MKVALISRAAFPLHGFGGLERHVGALFKYLRRAGCDVTLYTTPPAADVEAPEGVRFVPYRSLPWPRRHGFVIVDRDTNYLAWSLRVGKRALEEGRADVVQADGAAAFGYAFAASHDTAPFVLHPHGMEEFKAPPLKRAAYLPLRAATRYAARRAARVIAPDGAMKHEVTRYLGIDDERVAVVPNAIDLEALDAGVVSGAGATGGRLLRFGIAADADDRVLLSVGRLEANKGFDVLSRALAELRDLAWTWILVGDGPERDGLRHLVEALGLAERVTLAGNASDEELSALFERAHLVIHPTLYEGSSMVTLEAMAHRKPVVATRVGGIPDKVVDGESGRLVPAGDPDALAAAVREALRPGVDLALWGARGRRIVEERFDWATRVRDQLALYEALVR